MYGPHPTPTPVYRAGPAHADYMMICTSNDNRKNIGPPCRGECRFIGVLSLTESLCLICSMTPAEKDAWASLSKVEKDMLLFIVESRKRDMWDYWEYMTEPTIQ